MFYQIGHFGMYCIALFINVFLRFLTNFSDSFIRIRPVQVVGGSYLRRNTREIVVITLGARMSEFSSQEERFAKVSPYFSTRCLGNTAGLEKSYVVDREIMVFGDVSANQTSEIRDTRRRERIRSVLRRRIVLGARGLSIV